MEQKYVNHFMAEKAGMKDIDKKAIAQKIDQILAGTPKTLHEKELNDKRNLQIAEMKQKINRFTPEQRQNMRNEWANTIVELKANRVLSKIWAHFDFDMFFVACQLLQKPHLKDQPCAVGGRNSVLCTANYEARKYGVRSALPTFIALQLCPHLHLFEPDTAKYRHYSQIFRGILSEYDGEMESHGMDEAYVDLTEQLNGRSYEQASDLVREIRSRVLAATGLTVSCGVGANKMLAKLASEERKPDDQFILPNDAAHIEEYMIKKPIRKIPGIGPVNEYYLKGLGIETAQDILTHLDILSLCFTKPTAEFFAGAALGLGALHHDHQPRKTVGKSETFRPTDTVSFIQHKLKSLCEQLEMEMQQLGFVSNQLILGYQHENYDKKDKSFKLPFLTNCKQEFYKVCVAHLASLKHKIRLLGVRCSSLVNSEDHLKDQLMSFIQNKGKKQLGAVHSLRAEIAEISELMCPVCNKLIECKGKLSILNTHIDRCLQMGGLAEQTDPIQPQTEEIVEPHRVKSQHHPNSKQKTPSHHTEKQLKKKKKDTMPSIISFLKKQ